MSFRLIHGDEKYNLHLQKMDFVTAGDDPLSEPERFSAVIPESVTLDELSMFGRRRLLFEGSFRDLMKKELLELVHQHEVDVLVVVRDSVSNKNKIFKKIPTDKITQFPKLTKASYEKLVHKTILDMGHDKQVASKVLSRLDYLSSADITLFDVYNKLDILGSYTGELTDDILDKFLASDAESNVGKLVSAMIAGNDKVAYSYIQMENRAGRQMYVIGALKKALLSMLKISMGATSEQLGQPAWLYRKNKAMLGNLSHKSIYLMLDETMQHRRGLIGGTIRNDDVLFSLMIALDALR